VASILSSFDELFAPSTKLVWIVRVLFFFMAGSIATDVLVFSVERDRPPSEFWLGIASSIVAVVLCVTVVILDIVTKNKEIATLSAIYFGLLMGFLIGHLFWEVLGGILRVYLAEVLDIPVQSRPRFEYLAQLIIYVFSCYITVSTLLQTKDDFRLIIPYVEFSKELKGARPLVLDTSVIIDGRIADICDTGIIDTKLIVPRFVLQELQGIADSGDKIRRNRGRRGLDVLKRLQSNPKIDLQMHEANIAELRDVQKVDERLVVLAKALSARVVTNDFNLNKISQLQGVDVINLNELSNALKVVALPGEVLHVKVVKQGDQMGQGIGYLEDGTMVVVEHGRGSIGQEVTITVTSVLQTPAGRMIFGRLGGTGDHPPLPPEK